jgi:hypothetical protein
MSSWSSCFLRNTCHLAHLAFFSQSQLPFSLSLHCIVVQKHTPHELNNPSSSKNTFHFRLEAMHSTTQAQVKTLVTSHWKPCTQQTQAQVKTLFTFNW